MLARYYGANLGRFLSVDPITVTDDRLKNPQLVSLYSYVINNPLRLTDPTGMCGTAHPSNPGLCKINPDPDSDGKNEITFINDVKGGPSPDQFVTVETANMVEGAVVSSGVDSVNINSTTGSAGVKRGAKSRHGQGRAVDINKIDGDPVDQSKSGAADPKKVDAVQAAFAAEPNIRENFGPARNEKTSTPGGKAVPEDPKTARGKKIINRHKDHIHVSGQK